MRHALAPLLARAAATSAALFVSPDPASARDPDHAHKAAYFEDLPLIGGSGGHSYTLMCPSGQVLTGVRYRVGALVDGLGIKCSKVKADGSLGPSTDVGSMVGGNGGTAGSATCQTSGEVIAAQQGASAGVGIGGLHFLCFTWYGHNYGGTSNDIINVIGFLPAFIAQQCRDGNEPAIGIYGRHGSLVDAVGLKCGYVNH